MRSRKRLTIAVAAILALLVAGGIALLVRQAFFKPKTITAYFTSATAIFSSGTSFKWVRDRFCQDLVARAGAEGRDVYDLMTESAATSPVGARNLLFNPSLAGAAFPGDIIFVTLATQTHFNATSADICITLVDLVVGIRLQIGRQFAHDKLALDFPIDRFRIANVHLPGFWCMHGRNTRSN